MAVHTRWIGAKSGVVLGVGATTILAICLLALSAAGPAGAAFPGTNGPIAFQSDRDVAAAEIYTITPGGTATRITFSNSSSNPAYSPDGKRIAFVSSEPGGAYQIFVMNADGTGRKPITTGSSAKTEPAWSPDGTQIAYVSNAEIWAINVDGTGNRQLTNNTELDEYPAWSPQGDKIAFVHQQDVYLMNPDGTGQVDMTPSSGLGCGADCYGGADSDPAWSPSGSLIAYVHNTTKQAGGLPNIWILDPHSGAAANITPTEEVSLTEPAWSPQGDKIVMVGATTTNRDIWMMNADGSGLAPLETNPAHDINPDWGPQSPPSADTTPPHLGVSGKKRQRLGRGVKVNATCDESCTVRATGALVIAGAKGGSASAAGAGGRKLKLKAATAQIAAGGSATLMMKVGKKAGRIAKQALRQGRKVMAKLKVVAKDAAGNQATANRIVRLKL